MKIKILKQTENELKIEVEDAGHGICNLIQKKLLENKDVTQAGYDVPHPLASNPVIYVHTQPKCNPKKVLLEAVRQASESNLAFAKALTEALKA